MNKQFFLAASFAMLSAFPSSKGFARFTEPLYQEKIEAAAAASRASVFIPNKGQWASDVQFYGQSGNIDVWITTRGLEFDIHSSQITMPRSEDERYAFISEARISKIRRMGQLVRLENSGSPGAIAGLSATGSYRNYFFGKDRSKWVANAPVYEAVQINEMYPGIDVVAQFENALPRYDFIVKPGANPSSIALNFAGASKVSVAESGEYITLHTNYGDIRSGRIVAYQEVNEKRVLVTCAFMAKAGSEGAVQFRVGEYDRNLPLIIDPLVYATYIGESGVDKITAMLSDKSDNVIIAGCTDAATYPATTGVYDQSFNGGLDGFITKFDPTLSRIIFSTYIGGGADDIINSASIDDAQNIYVGGETASSSFPTPGGWKSIFAGGIDGFVAKLSADGSQLGYSSFIGGVGNDRVLSVNSNQIGELAVGGETNSVDFATGGTSLYQKVRQGGFDGFLARFKPTGASVDFSTYLGGAGDDRINSVSYNPGSSYIYFGGEAGNPLTPGTNSNGTFPVPVPPSGPNPGDPGRKPYDNTFNGGVDGIVGNISAFGTFNDNNSQYLGYIGSNLDDRVTAVAVGQDNSLIVTGATKMGQTIKFPLQTGQSKGGFDVFAARVKAGGRDLLFTTTFGGSGDDAGSAIMPIIDLLTGAAGDYYIAGVTASSNFQTTAVSPILSPIQTVPGGKTDMFVARINSVFNVIYASYHGGKGDDAATAILATDRGDYYVAGVTTTDSIGSVAESYKKKRSGGTDGYIAKVVVTGQVSISSPATNASFCPGGAPTNISWTRQDLDPSNEIKMYFSSDAGSTWNYIDSTDKMVYGWKIPANAIPANTYRIRLVHYSGLKSESGNFTVLGPASVATQPMNDTVCPGQAVHLIAKGAGSGKLTYQWKKNGAVINGARDSIFSISSATPQDAGEYTVDIGNTCTTATSKGAAIVVKTATKITEQPKGGTIKEQQTFSFTVKGVGLKQSYQWYKDGFKLLNETNSSYTIASAKLGDAGSYSVTISGECGFDSSQAAVLNVQKKDPESVTDESLSKLRPQISAQNLGDEVTAYITPNMQGSCGISFTDVNGRVIAKNYFNGAAGVTQSFAFNVAALPAGIYWIAVEQNGVTGALKLSVAR